MGRRNCHNFIYSQLYMHSILIWIFLLASVTVLGSALGDRHTVIEAQLVDLLSKVKDKTIGILTNPTSVDSRLGLMFERLLLQKDAYNITIKCFFAPEHGLRGDRQAGAGDDDYVDGETGITVYSLYGVRKAPTSDQLRGLDLLLYDIQDVGTRYYTYIWTLTYTIEALAQSGVELAIFDRPNPLGRQLEGCPLKLQAGLIGRLLPGQSYSIPTRYGLTVGQLIGYLRRYLPPFKLTVIKMSSLYEISAEEWVISSPNMPTLQTALVYPGMGLFEGTSLSEGRGTTKPFQMSGNTKLIASKILSYFASNKIQLPGCILREAYFIPTFSKHVGEVCGGVEIHVTDSRQYRSIPVALHLLQAYLSVSQAGSVTLATGIDKMFGRLGFKDEILLRSVDAILADCSDQLQMFRRDSANYYLYTADSIGRQKTSQLN